MAGRAPSAVQARALGSLRLLAPTNVVLDGMDSKVAQDFTHASQKLRNAGTHINEHVLEPLDRMAGINSKGGFLAAEAVHWHQELMAEDPDTYDPRVIVRIRKGEGQSAADYITLCQERDRYIADMVMELAGYGATIMPTDPTVAPKIADLDGDEQLYGVTNLLMLRNPATINLLDSCARSLPMHETGTAPTGLTIAGLNGGDAQIFAIAHGLIETL